MNTFFSDAQNAQNGNLSLKPLETLNGQVQNPFTVASAMYEAGLCYNNRTCECCKLSLHNRTQDRRFADNR